MINKKPLSGDKKWAQNKRSIKIIIATIIALFFMTAGVFAYETYNNFIERNIIKEKKPYDCSNVQDCPAAQN